MIRLLRKHHRWFGLILLVFLILFSISGIILNHRKTFSAYSISRNYLPGNYAYQDWNFAAVRSTEKISNDSMLVYGNIGIWLTDSAFGDFTEFHTGFPKGVDNHKISKVLKINNKNIAAGSIFGLHIYNTDFKKWQKIELPNQEENVVDMLLREDTLLVLTRSNLFKSTDYKIFEKVSLPPPAGYNDKIGLFKTFWVLHSGELYGLTGRLIVDLIGIIMIFLSVTGFIIYINKNTLKKKKTQKVQRTKLKRQYLWNLKWHNKLGWTTAILLIITTLSGIFLRPPLLIPIAESKVNKIPFSLLDTPNPWFDQLRRIIYIEDEDRYIISTAETFYYSDDNLLSIKAFDKQPPFSVMGVTVLEKKAANTLWVGSFNGLFSWNYNTDEIYDLIDEKPWVRPTRKSHPVGSHKIVGYTEHVGNHPFIFDYETGSFSKFNQDEFAVMPEIIIQKNPMPLWNLAQEIHTGRIFQFMMGDFYILIVPLTGLFTIYLIVSGFIIWYKKYRTKKSVRSHTKELEL